MWKYRIVDGAMISADGKLTFNGYSGTGHTLAEGRNNPVMVDQHDKGPIPPGDYAIGIPHSSNQTGPYTMNLDPINATNTFGRSAFRIHGNNAANDASHGCIILPPDARRAVWESNDHQVRVVVD
jgi:lipoprotein-anchoring transpeptidase ErfK/SrfK